MRFRWACLTLCASQFCGCENPEPALTLVDPGQAYSDHGVGLTLLGNGFLPTTSLDPATGSRDTTIDVFRVRVGHGSSWVELTDLAWQSTSQMTAFLSSDSALALPTGFLDVEIVDPRGRRADLPNGFRELGPDVTSPIVTFTSPAANTPVGPGTLLRGTFHASDALPGALVELDWSYSESGVTRPGTSCGATLPAPEADCAFQVRVSQSLIGGEQIQITAHATDDSIAQNRGEKTLPFTVLAMPSIASISPATGGTLGGTDVVITGTGFIAGSQAMIDGIPLFPEGGIVINENTLSGHVPAHAEGAVPVIVRTPIGNTSVALVFVYLPPPLVESITPNVGAAEGGTAVLLTGENFSATTQIFFGTTLDGAVPLGEPFLQSNSTIVGRAPAGSGQTTVWAFDAALGFTKLPSGFGWSTP